MWMSFWIVINFDVPPGQMSIMAVVVAEGVVVNIQMLGVSWDGILTSWVFLICSEDLVEMLHAFLVYRAVMRDCGFASGWKGVISLQNCPLAFWQVLNWWGDISTAIVSSWVMSRYWVLISYIAVKFPCGMSKVKTLYIESAVIYPEWVHLWGVKIVCWQLEHGCKDTCKNAICHQMILVGAMWVVAFPLCVLTSS